MFSGQQAPPSYLGTVHPDLAFSAPESVQLSKASPSSDIWAFGMLLSALLAAHRKQPVAFAPASTTAYARDVRACVEKLVGEAGGDLRGLLEGCLRVVPEERWTVSEVKRCRYFNDQFMHTYKYLTNITELDRKQQITFVRGLPEILHQF
jgi:serine/threonine protein kinase